MAEETTADLALLDQYDSDVVPWDGGGGSLDELRDDEIPTPRITIDGKTTQFVNADTGERYDTLEVIILGLVRNRVFWDPDATPAQGTQPWCRSMDSVTGRPNVRDDCNVKEQFPWKSSNFNRNELPLEEGTNQPLAECAKCVFSEWREDNKPPLCSERLTLPVYYKDPYGTWSAGLVTFKGSGFRPTTKYLGAIKAKKHQPFQFITKISLVAQRSGDVDFATPKYERTGISDPGNVVREDGTKVPQNWLDAYAAFEQIKAFLRRPPRVGDDDRYADEAYQPTKPSADQTADNSNVAPPPREDVVDAEVVSGDNGQAGQQTEMEDIF